MRVKGASYPTRTDVSRTLEVDRQFHAPDFGCRLASALGLSSSLAGLSGSLVLMPENREGVPTTRRWIKARLARAWSDRALKNGIHKAKSGQSLQEVLPDYREALDWDPTNADAYVGMGAALANSFHWHEAVEALQTALKLQPDHAHAADYLARIKQRASGAGVNLPENEGHRDVAGGEVDPRSRDGPSNGHQSAEDHGQSSPVVGMDKQIAAALGIVMKHHSRERKRRKEKESRRHKYEQMSWKCYTFSNSIEYRQAEIVHYCYSFDPALVHFLDRDKHRKDG